ncbi:MAG: hypothetical protein IH618_07955, partial [Ignavibacteriaceae bacterium]|nr:hypothetical protein [Ignavibacteriaceae bacterium]
MKNSAYKFSFLFMCLIVSMLSTTLLYPQDKLSKAINSADELRSNKMLQQEYNIEDTESATGVQFYQKAKKKPNEPWVDELHEARLQNDIQRMREIESQHSIPINTNGESFHDPVIRISGTVGHSGEPLLLSGSGNIQSPLDWGNDIHVRSAGNSTFQESHPSMATASDGTIYIVWENVGQSGYNDYLMVYYSLNGGFSWAPYGFFENPSYNLREPSLAIGEGNQSLLLIAYIVDDGVVPFPEVATTPLYQIGFNWTVHSV